MCAEEFEALLVGQRVAFHEDALGPLDHGAAAEGAFEVVVVGEPFQGDVDRALELLGVAVGDICPAARE